MNITFIKRLITGYKDGTATPAERYVLERWYDSFDIDGKPVTLFNDPDYLDGFKSKVLADVVPARGGRRYRLSWIHIAAMFLVAITVAFIVHIGNDRESLKHTVSVAYRDISAGPGETKRLVLQDSSEIFLNANSTLRIASDFGSGNREVSLSGEAFFNIKPDEKHPFVVHTASLDIRVLGTSFNVNTYSGLDYVRVGVKSGKVAVTRGEADLATLDAGKQLRFDRHTGKAEIQSGIIVNHSWAGGKVKLVDADFAELRQVFHNTYGIYLESNDPMVTGGRFNLSVSRSRPLSTALDKLCTLIGKNYRKEAENSYYIH